MKKFISIIFVCLLFVGCLSIPNSKECQQLKEIEAAEQAGRVDVVVPGGDDPYTYLVWRDIKGEIIKMARFIMPKLGQEL